MEAVTELIPETEMSFVQQSPKKNRGGEESPEEPHLEVLRTRDGVGQVQVVQEVREAYRRQHVESHGAPQVWSPRRIPGHDGGGSSSERWHSTLETGMLFFFFQLVLK